MRQILIATALAAFTCYPAFSGAVSYSATGTFWASGTPSTAFSANGSSFEFDFSLPDMPVPSNSVPQDYFSVAVPVTYKLGTTTFAPQTIYVFFFASNSLPSGGFLIAPFPSSDVGIDSVTYIFTGYQLFTGTTSAPTLTPGTFVIGNATIQVNTGGTGTAFPVASTLTATTTPEPACLSLAALALAAGAIRRLKGRPKY
jgi:hypothetical protein